MAGQDHWPLVLLTASKMKEIDMRSVITICLAILFAGCAAREPGAGLHGERVTESPKRAPCVMVEVLLIEIEFSEDESNDLGFDYTLPDSRIQPQSQSENEID